MNGFPPIAGDAGIADRSMRETAVGHDDDDGDGDNVPECELGPDDDDEEDDTSENSVTPDDDDGDDDDSDGD